MELIKKWMIDPPWQYGSRKTGGEVKTRTQFGGGAEKHYVCPAWRVERRLKAGWSEKKANEANLTDAELLEVGKYIALASDPDSHMFCWRTCPTLDFFVKFMEAMKYKPKTDIFNWLKTTDDQKGFRYGPSYYRGSNLEPVCIGKRGKGLGAPAVKLRPSIVVDYDPESEDPLECFDERFARTVTICPRFKHSEKPDIHEAIDEMWPGIQGVELFARREKPGWVCLGGDLTGNDILQDLAELIKMQKSND